MRGKRYDRYVDRKLESGYAWYSRGKYARAQKRYEQVLAVAESPALRAYCMLSIGRLYEQRQEWQAALDWYLRAFAMDQEIDEVWYFISNNAGYCMNRLGRHREAEAMCRIATGILPDLPNAWKNLGVALEGLCRWSDAAASYLIASECWPEDTRALNLLERLLAERPEAGAGVQNFAARLAECRSAT